MKCNVSKVKLTLVADKQSEDQQTILLNLLSMEPMRISKKLETTRPLTILEIKIVLTASAIFLFS